MRCGSLTFLLRDMYNLLPAAAPTANTNESTSVNFRSRLVMVLYTSTESSRISLNAELGDITTPFSISRS